MPSKGDWEFGQKLIEMDYSTLDKVRECLDLQQKITSIGSKPKSLADIMIEKGYITQTQAIAVKTLLSGHVSHTQRETRPPEEHSTTLPFRQESATHGMQPFAQQPTHQETSHKPPPVVVAAHHHHTHSAIARARTGSGSGFLAVLLVLVAAGAVVYLLMNNEEESAEPPTASTQPFQSAPAPRAIPSPPSAEKELAAITAAQKEDIGVFKKMDAILKLYADFISKYSGTVAAKDAEGHRKSYLQEAERTASSELEALKSRAKSALGRDALGEIVVMYRKFPVQFLERTQAGREVKETIARTMEKIDEKYQLDKNRLDREIAEGKYEEAMTTIDQMLLYLDRDRQVEIEQRRNDLKKRNKQRSSRKVQEIADAYLTLSLDAKREMYARNYETALRKIAAFLADKYPLGGEEAFGLSAEMYKTLSAALNPKAPDVDAIVARTEEALRNDPAPSLQEMPSALLFDLRNAALLTMIARAIPGVDKLAAADVETRLLGTNKETLDKSPSANLQLGIFFYYCHDRGADAKAIAYLDRAERLGAVGASALKSSLAGDISALKEKRFQQELTLAKESFAGRDWGAVVSVLNELVKSGGESGSEKNKRDIDAMLDTAKKGEAKIKQLEGKSSARVTDAGNGLFKFAYDFERPEQINAFQSVKEGWAISEGKLTGKGSPAIVWKTASGDSVIVEFDFMPIDPHNFVVNLCYNTEKESGYYACVFGIDLVPGEVEKKNGLPPTTLFKYPVNADFRQWQLPSFWEAWKKAVIGRAIKEFTPLTLGKYRVKIERNGKSINIYIDGAQIWEGSDNSCAGGSVAFNLSKSHVLIDNLSFLIKAE